MTTRKKFKLFIYKINLNRQTQLKNIKYINNLFYFYLNAIFLVLDKLNL